MADVAAVPSAVAVRALYPSTPRCRITAHAIAIGAPGRVPWMFGEAQKPPSLSSNTNVCYARKADDASRMTDTPLGA